jgi:hypothetical protein
MDIFDKQLSKRVPKYQNTKRYKSDKDFGKSVLVTFAEKAAIEMKDFIKLQNAYEARFWARKSATFALDKLRNDLINN